MKLDTLNSSSADAINLIAMQIKKKLERFGVRQAELHRGNPADTEASIVADIGDHVITRSDMLIRVTAPDEFIVQLPTRTARLVGVKDSQTVHSIEQLNMLLARVATII